MICQFISYMKLLQCLQGFCKSSTKKLLIFRAMCNITIYRIVVSFIIAELQSCKSVSISENWRIKFYKRFNDLNKKFAPH